MTGRMFCAMLLLAAMLLAGTFFLFVSVMPILIGAGALGLALAAGVLALGTGHLPRWIEIEEVAEPERAHPHGHLYGQWLRSLRFLAWPRV